MNEFYFSVNSLPVIRATFTKEFKTMSRKEENIAKVKIIISVFDFPGVRFL